MPCFRVTYRPGAGRPDEDVDGDRVEVEGGVHLVVRRTVLVIGHPRDVVVRRLVAADVLAVDVLP